MIDSNETEILGLESWQALFEVSRRSFGIAPEQIKQLLSELPITSLQECVVAPAGLTTENHAGRQSHNESRHVVVIGAGVAGLTAAHELAERGFTVDVYESDGCIGGKSKTARVNGEGAIGTPIEHGFRFLPSFCTHLRDTMERIPTKDNSCVRDHLIPMGRMTNYAAGMETKSERFDSIQASDSIFDPKEADDVWRNLMFLLSCNERRETVYEKILYADLVSEDGWFTKAPKLLMACTSDVISARTAITTFFQLLNGRRGEVNDEVFDGPTSDVWFDPWLQYLEQLGVRFHYGADVTALGIDNGKLNSLQIAIDGDQHRVEVDHAVLAIPAQQLEKLIPTDIATKHADLADIAGLKHDWMHGLQYSLDVEIPIPSGAIGCVDTPWGITAVNYTSMWSSAAVSRHIPKDSKTFLSLIVADWWSEGTGLKLNASVCTQAQLFDEAWHQFVESFREDNEIYPLLKAHKPTSTMLGPGMTPLDEPTAEGITFENNEQLFMNSAGSWEKRPDAVTSVDGLFLAGDFIKTNTDCASMESANEAARRAVNGILLRCGEEDNFCRLNPLQEPPWLGLLKALDRRMYAAGEAPFISTLPDKMKDQVLRWIKDLYVAENPIVSGLTLSALINSLSMEDVAILSNALIPVFNGHDDRNEKLSDDQIFQELDRDTQSSVFNIGKIEARHLVNRLRTLFYQPPILLDTRSAEAFSQHHIIQARSVPAPDAGQTAIEALDKELRNELQQMEGHLVVIYSDVVNDSEEQSDIWSVILAKTIAELGHDVRFLQCSFDGFIQQRPYVTTTAMPTESADYFSDGQQWPVEVMDGFLYLGDRKHGADADLLHDLGITHVFNMAREVVPTSIDGITVAHWPLTDDSSEDIHCHLKPITDQVLALNDLFKNNGAGDKRASPRVLIHCRMGFSRSAATVVACMMRIQQIGVDSALKSLVEQHTDTYPNRGFMQQLKRFESDIGLLPKATLKEESITPIIETYPPLPEYLDKNNLPQHVGIIMDGNRRWSAKRKRNLSDGHARGSAIISDVLYGLSAWGIKKVTLYAFSTENWQRPQREIDVLFDLIEIKMERELEKFIQWGIRLVVAGDTNDPRIPDSVKKILTKVKRATQHCNRTLVTVAFNYGGRQDIVSVVNQCLEEQARGEMTDKQVTTEDISRRLLGFMPGGDVDLLIRTSGEKRLSNFMLWELCYAELYFTDRMFPELTLDDLAEALAVYQGRQRRLGI